METYNLNASHAQTHKTPPPPSNNVESFNSVVVKFVHCQISKGLCLGLKFLYV